MRIKFINHLFDKTVKHQHENYIPYLIRIWECVLHAIQFKHMTHRNYIIKNCIFCIADRNLFFYIQTKSLFSPWITECIKKKLLVLKINGFSFLVFPQWVIWYRTKLLSIASVLIHLSSLCWCNFLIKSYNVKLLNAHNLRVLESVPRSSHLGPHIDGLGYAVSKFKSFNEFIKNK